MRKRGKQIIMAIAIVLGSLSILVIAGVALMFFLGLPFYLTGVYFECNPERMLSHLEKTFVINFPEQQIKEVRTAKSFGWDDSVGFKVRFAADPNVVEHFLESFPKKVEFEPYDSKLDTRGSGTTPRWFTVPIMKGKKDTGVFLGPHKKRRSMSIYIDTTNKKSFVVYIRGSYNGELDY